MLGGIFHLHTNLTRCDKSVCSRLSAALPAVAIILFHIHQFHIAHTLHYGAHMQLSLSEYVAEIICSSYTDLRERTVDRVQMASLPWTLLIASLSALLQSDYV